MSLKKYRCVKDIAAKPMGYKEAYSLGLTEDFSVIYDNENYPGYYVEYYDGYKSWISKEDFEKGYVLEMGDTKLNKEENMKERFSELKEELKESVAAVSEKLTTMYEEYTKEKGGERVEKTMGNTCANGASKNVKDIVFWGNGDAFKLISKASSEAEGWMKSTKAMQCGTSVVVQVTTQQRNPDGSYSVAEALTTVPNAEIIPLFDDKDDINKVTSRVIAERIDV